MAYSDQTGELPAGFGPFTISDSSCAKAARVFGLCEFSGVSNTSKILNNADDRKFANVTVNGKPIRGWVSCSGVLRHAGTPGSCERGAVANYSLF